MGKNEGEVGKAPSAHRQKKHSRGDLSEGARVEIPSEEEEGDHGKEIGGDEGHHPPAIPKAVGNEARKGKIEIEKKERRKEIRRRHKPEGELFFQGIHVIRPPLRC